MRNRFRHHSGEAVVDLTPMLDVVFILLIFFIVTSTFIQEDAIGLEPPPPSGGQDMGTAYVVYINSDGLVTVNNRLTDLGSVGSGFERLRAESPDTPLVIQADQTAPTGHVIRIRDAAYSAGIERVNLVRSEH